MNIHVPPAIKSLSPVLSEFFEGMVFKLNVNSHKDAIRDDDVDILIDRLMEELQEFKDQRAKDGHDPNILSELHDMGNFCFLLYAYLRNKGVMDLKERFIREFYEINAYTGRVYCKKTRAGSPLKVGDEVTGTERNGVVYIRAQHTASGASISVARRDVIWWWHHGVWPSGTLRYRTDMEVSGRLPAPSHTVDRLSNLLPPSDVPEKLYPFVSRYAPKGRENTANWGKYVYQRRHRLKLIRVGYWDTEEEAAREGVKAWKEKTRV